MMILPAIDLKDGAVVRLYKGSFDTVHQVATDPVTVARAFQEAGATWIHMVDLDGARDGVRRNAQLVQAVAALGLQVELGGGIRSMEDLKAVFAPTRSWWPRPSPPMGPIASPWALTPGTAR